jgi:hypothetical protein
VQGDNTMDGQQEGVAPLLGQEEVQLGQGQEGEGEGITMGTMPLLSGGQGMRMNISFDIEDRKDTSKIRKNKISL